MNTTPHDPRLDGDDSDIAALKLILEQPDWQYVDFAGDRERAVALQRWPLLAEIAAQYPPAQRNPAQRRTPS